MKLSSKVRLTKAFVMFCFFTVPKEVYSQSITFIELMKFCSEKGNINVDSVFLSKGFSSKLIINDGCDGQLYISNENPLETCLFQKEAVFFETNNKNAYVNWRNLDTNIPNLLTVSEFNQKPSTFSQYYFITRKTYKGNNYFLQTGIYLDDASNKIITFYLYNEKSCYHNLKKDLNIPKSRK